jgi:GNAT superfamily N-acetyltransferase
MLAVELNPPGIEDSYLGWLNVCFKSPWSPRMYAWYLRRPFAGMRPDLMVLREHGRVVAGTGMNYRRLRLEGGACIDVAILTAGWTLPEARGRGLFDHLVRASSRLAAERGCVLLLGFVTRDNSSARMMRRCGSTMLPTTYLFSPPPRGPSGGDADAASARPSASDAVEKALSSDPGSAAVRFDYPRREDWRSQFLDRPHAVETLAIGKCHAVVELTGGADRLQLLVGPVADRAAALAALAARARARNRCFFAFASGSPDPGLARALGLTWKAGDVTLLVLRPKELASAWGVAGTWPSMGAWDIQSGDRM